MFGSFKEKLQSVGDNLSASFRGISVSEEKIKPINGNSHLARVNLNAGVDVLEKFRGDWAELHRLAQGNAKNAQFVDDLIGKLHKRLEREWRNVGQLTSALSRLPEVIHEVDILNEKLVTVDDLFVNVEKALLHLEDLIETRELQEKQLDHRFQLALYKEKKLRELDNTRMALAKDHAEKVAIHEARQQRIQRERREAFEQQFKQDLNVYKQTNSIPKVELRPKSSPETTLEEVILDNTNDEALNEFLRDNTPEHSENYSSLKGFEGGENDGNENV